jgi:hypothetical protein
VPKKISCAIYYNISFQTVMMTGEEKEEVRTSHLASFHLSNTITSQCNYNDDSST